MDDLVLVGRVARAHGNRGHVIVNLETDFAEERFRVGGVVLVGEAATPRAIEAVRFHQGRPIIALEGIRSMDDAEALAGADLRVPEGALGSLPDGMFRHYDLVGCEVRDTAGAAIGRVRSIEGTLERSRLVVDGARGEVLVPLVAEICVEIDLDRRTIVIRPPEGLIELNQAAP